MQLAEVVDAWEQLRSTRSRRNKVEIVSDLLGRAELDDVSLAVSYLSGELPQGRIGLGYAAVGSLSAQPTSVGSLELAELDTVLSQIKATTGPGSKAAKADLLVSVLARCTETQQEFVKRLLLGNLRQGALVGIMVDTIASAAGVDIDLVRHAAMVSGDLPEVATRALGQGVDGLGEFGLQLFTALQPMLAQTASDVAAAIHKVGRAGIEWKVDGARVQVHRQGDQVSVFTRNLRDITSSAVDVVEAARSLDVSSIILDGEAVAFGPKGRPAAFQETMSRFAAAGSGALDVVFFDILHLDGTDLISRTGEERWEALHTVVPEQLLIPRTVTDDATVANSVLDDAIAAGHEGVVVKALDASYAAGRRGAAWLKVKPVHTLDLVVLAVEWGSGRRTGWLSNIHLGARDPSRPGEFVMLGKTFKGMTDEMLAWQTERFLELEARRDGRTVHLRPEQVVEVAVDGIQASSRYPGGVALRFARVRRYRDDKTADQADTLAAVRTLGGGRVE